MVKEPKPLENTEGDFEPIDASGSGIQPFMDATNKRFIDVERLTKAILFVAVISLVGVVVAVSGLIIDQVHFNNQTYRQQQSDNQLQIRLLQNEINELKAANEQKTVQTTN